MLIEKADMLDALLGNFVEMGLLADAEEGNCGVLCCDRCLDYNSTERRCRNDGTFENRTNCRRRREDGQLDRPCGIRRVRR